MPNCKTCTICGEKKSIESFRLKTSYGNKYRSSYCRSCDNRDRYKRRNGKESLVAMNARAAERERLSRKNGTNTARWILEDSRREDRKRGLTCDLDKSWIENMISCGCVYCGETTIRMTLDRIDNTKGHLKDNVVPACIRCNYTRRNMPYEAWLCLCDGMKKARELGLFGEWTGRVR